MDSPKATNKKGLLSKTWNRCKSFSGGIGRKGGIESSPDVRSQSWPRGSHQLHDQIKEMKGSSTKKKRSHAAPGGCFSIYVGKERERFVIKTEYVNHPLFRMLLEEAESEYGYASEGPLLLPCEANHFVQVLMEIGCRDYG